MMLYTFDPAPNPRRVNLFLAYKGVTLPTQQVNLRELQQFTPEFKAMNPRCIVPALRLEDGKVLCDAVAICWYLESCYPQKPLFGTNPLQQAEVLSWDQQVFTDGFIPVAEALRNRGEMFKDRAVPGPKPVAQIAELETRGRQRLQVFWQGLEDHLQGRQYLVGNALTFADIDAFVVVDFAGWIKESLPADKPQLQAWYQRVKAQLSAA
jgi:glutathione S-transferase